MRGDSGLALELLELRLVKVDLVEFAVGVTARSREERTGVTACALSPVP